MPALVFLLLLSGFSSAQDYGVSCVMSEAGAFSIVYVVIMASVLVVALAYMLAQLLHQPQWEAWAKLEATTLMFSVLLAVLLPVLLGVGCAYSSTVAGSVVGAPSADPFAVSEYYLLSATTAGQRAALELTQGSLQNQFRATDYLYVYYIFKSCGISYNANYRAHSSQREMLIDILLPSMQSLNLQAVFLNFVRLVVPGILLPIALVFRFLPGLRDAGNFLIALAFGLYIVLPATYVLGFAAFMNTPQVALFTPDPAAGELATVAQLLPQAILLPNIALVILITFVMSISRALKVLQV